MKQIIALLLLLFVVSCNKKEQPFDDKSAKDMLMTFYTEYLNASETLDNDKYNEVLNKYCTTELISRLHETYLDADPFLNAQDSTIDWIPTLGVKAIDKQNHIYRVCYTDISQKDPTCMELTVILTDEGYKISNVFLNTLE